MGCLVGLAELLTSFEAPFGTPRNKWKVDEFMNDQSLSNDLLKIYLAEKLISVAGQDYVDLLLRKRTQVAERPGEEVLEKARAYLEYLLGDPSLDEGTRLRTVKEFLNIWGGR